MPPTKKAEPPPTRDVNRDSGTANANGSGDLIGVGHQCKTFLKPNLCPFSLMITNSWSSTRTIGSGGTLCGRDTPYSLQLVYVHTTALFVSTNVPPHCAARRR